MASPTHNAELNSSWYEHILLKSQFEVLELYLDRVSVSDENKYLYRILNISLFSIPKAFTGRSAIHQNNAIATWRKLPTQPEVFLCGNDPGVAGAAQASGSRHLPNIKCTDQGTPLLDDAFAQVHAQAKGEILVYVNADILLLPDFIPAIEQTAQQHSQFLMLGRRWNLDVEQPIAFEDIDWRSQLLKNLHRYGIFSGIGALDYFVFPKPLFAKIPPFAVGRAGWDNWMVGEALNQGYPVVNVSQVVTVIHQNHDYAHLPGKRLEAFHGTEAKQNRTFLKSHLAGNSANATHVLRRQNQSPRVSIVLATPADVSEPAAMAKPRQRRIAAELAQTVNQLSQQTYADFEIVSPSQQSPNPVVDWNQGLANAKGEFVLFLDTRVQLLPEALAAWVAQIDKSAGSLEMSCAGWQAIARNDDTSASTNTSITDIQPWLQLKTLLAGREGLQGLHVWVLPTIWFLLHPSSVLFRRDWLARFSTEKGVLNEQLQAKAAVIDLMLRLFSRGAAATYLEASVLQDKGITNQKMTSGGTRGSTRINAREIQKIEQDCSQIVSDFFAQKHIPRWAQPLEGHAKQTIERWLTELKHQPAADSTASPQFL